ncbi:MAG: ribonuclease Z [Fimbriimonadaceae bacterium]|nr:ribonuclease Z [Fimbriimonadaceae bacterium]
MQVVFLGTSSATPTPRRFLPAAVLARQGELFLFDCGEGTQIRFRKSRLKFTRLTWILISHMHGDHVTGLLGLLMSLQMAERQEPLRIVGPAGLQDYVLMNKRLLRTDFTFPLEFTEVAGEGALVYDGPEYVIEAGLLQHRVPCYGYAVAEKDRPGVFDLAAAAALGVPVGPLFGQLQQGRSVTLDDGQVVRPEQVLGPPRPGMRVAYVSDTRPCRNALVLARGADLLIHEATFAGELADEARAKRHCTATEAAEIARQAGAKRLVLTHFSPRYLDLEPLRAEAATTFEPVECAHDLFEVEL